MQFPTQSTRAGASTGENGWLISVSSDGSTDGEMVMCSGEGEDDVRWSMVMCWGEGELTCVV
jgi:hypothetical protein